MKIVRTVATDRPRSEVFAYLSDFTTTEEWDPGTLRTTRESGDGGVGTRYRNVSKFLGRETELTYVVEESSPPHRLRLRGENDTLVAHDTMTLSETPGGGTELTYRADFAFKGAGPAGGAAAGTGLPTPRQRGRGGVEVCPRVTRAPRLHKPCTRSSTPRSSSE